MGELAALVKKHPEFIGLAVIVVILLAYWQSRGNNNGATVPSDGSGGEVTFTGGGVARPPLDPNAAAIQEAQIGANAANLTTLSQLWLGLNEAAYARDVQQGQTSAGLTASLAQTEAQRTLGLDSGVTQRYVAGVQADEQLNALNVTSQMAANAQASNIQALQLDNQRQLEINATQRDIARVQAKRGFWDSLIGGIEGVGEIVAAAF